MKTLYERVAVALVVVFCSVAFVSTAWAQSADDFTRLGNDAYNGGRYSEAVGAYVKAIQLEPAKALRAYRNMARAQNQLRQYDGSVQYYEWYLELASDADDARKIRAELRRVKRKANGTNIQTEAQTAALGRLQQAIKDGRFIEDEGGALAHYDVLLRTGYAAPPLRLVQRDLAQGLAKEAFVVTEPPPGQPVAALDREGWKLVKARIERAHGFAGVTLPELPYDALLATADGWDLYLKGDYIGAYDRFSVAVEGGPTLLAAHWGKALASIFTDSGDMALARAAVDAAEAAYTATGCECLRYTAVLRALIEQAAGDAKGAATLVQAL